MKNISILCIALAMLFGCSAGRETVSKEDTAPRKEEIDLHRLKLLTLVGSSCKIKTSGACHITDSISKIQLSALASGAVVVEYSETGLVINGKSFNNGSIIVAGEDDRIEIEGTIFRGYAEISKENGKLLVINNIGLEECVYSHVGRELSAGSPSEALKAQAVAARTFLLHEKQSYKNKDYDLNNLEKSRTYFGVSFENPQSIKATDNTAGIIVKYKGERAFTPYFANCGGYTEDVAEIWGAKMPYLSPVPCFFCKNGRHYTWEAEIQEDHIVASLNKKGYKVTSVSDINPRHEVTKSGRAKKIKLITNSGEIVIDLENFRQLVGYNLLKSARSLTARPRGGKFKFTGKGWGHGTGMCQEGAEGMAREGHKFKEILRRYYPGTEISSK